MTFWKRDRPSAMSQEVPGLKILPGPADPNDPALRVAVLQGLNQHAPTVLPSPSQDRVERALKAMIAELELIEPIAMQASEGESVGAALWALKLASMRAALAAAREVLSEMGRS